MTVSEQLLRNCTGCGKVFEQPRRRGAPRRKCDTCAGRSAPTVARSTMVMLGDPPVRPDGRCACGCGKSRRTGRDVKTYAGAQIDLDPFATTECCKRFHSVPFGVSDESEEMQERRRAGGAVAAAQHRERHPKSVPGVFTR